MPLYQPQAFPLASMAANSYLNHDHNLSIETEPLMGNSIDNQQSFDKADAEYREDVEASPTHSDALPMERIELTEEDVHHLTSLQFQGSLELGHSTRLIHFE
jgi:hypothetical protein